MKRAREDWPQLIALALIVVTICALQSDLRPFRNLRVVAPRVVLLGG